MDRETRRRLEHYRRDTAGDVENTLIDEFLDGEMDRSDFLRRGSVFGLSLTTRTFGAIVFDYNNDGWPDIFLSRHDAEAFLYRNDHGHFVRDESTVFPGHVDRQA